MVAAAWISPLLMLLAKCVSAGWLLIAVLLTAPLWGAVGVGGALILTTQLSPSSAWRDGRGRQAWWLLTLGTLWSVSWVAFGVGIPDAGDDGVKIYNVLTRLFREHDPTSSQDPLILAGVSMAMVGVALVVVIGVALVAVALSARHRRQPAYWAPRHPGLR